MALFTHREKATVPELIARRKYRDALELLKEQLKLRPDDKSLRLQSADVLVLMGMIENATRVLSSVADDFASEGFAAKAVAVLKKVQRLEPERRDIERRIVEIFKGGMPPPGPAAAVTDFRELRAADVDHHLVAPVSTAEGPPPAPPPAAVPASFEAGFPPAEELDIGFAAEGPAPEVDLTFLEQSARGAGEAAPNRVVSPLFDDLAEDELLEFIRGLELLGFEPGDIVVTEGEAGDSLYVITTGLVKAFVRNQEGGSTQVRELHEGDFFG